MMVRWEQKAIARREITRMTVPVSFPEVREIHVVLLGRALDRKDQVTALSLIVFYEVMTLARVSMTY